jgi:hypothetical protein
METRDALVVDPNGRPIRQSRALLWGNNAAWLCVKCKRLLGNRTANRENMVACLCGTEYEILRHRNRNGRFHLGPAAGVQRL